MIEDKRISYIEFFGRKFPMCLTVLVQDQITSDYGSVVKLLEKLEDDSVDALPYWVDLLHSLMVGGAARVKALGFLSGETVETPAVPSVDQLQEIVGWADIREYTADIFKAVGLSMDATVELEEENEKNAETAQE